MKLSSIPAYARGLARTRHFSRPPVIVGGCERSGTTLLQAILSAHPRIHAFSDELWAFCYGPSAGFPSPNPIKMRRLWKALGKEPVKETAWRWCEKSPANVFYFGQILEHFRGRVRLIQMVRDGRDVTTSIHPDRPDQPWVSVARWVRAVQAGLAWRDHPRVLTIRYVDLVTDYEPTVRRICAFLDEDFTPEMRDWSGNVATRTSPNLVGGKVGRLRSSSVGKFMAPDFPYGDVVQRLMDDDDARRLLEVYGFLEAPPPNGTRLDQSA